MRWRSVRTIARVRGRCYTVATQPRDSRLLDPLLVFDGPKRANLPPTPDLGHDLAARCVVGARLSSALSSPTVVSWCRVGLGLFVCPLPWEVDGDGHTPAPSPAALVAGLPSRRPAAVYLKFSEVTVAEGIPHVRSPASGGAGQPRG
jgi:hypothetical protein